MKLFEIIKAPEKDYAADIVKIIKRDCSPFLSEMGSETKPLLRGLKNAQNKEIILNGSDYNYDELSFSKSSVRKDRTASDSSWFLTSTLDKYFKNKIGAPLRSAGLFCTFDKSTASGYGDVYVIFPIGNIKYAWSRIVRDAYDGLDPYGNASWFVDKKISDIVYKYAVKSGVLDNKELKKLKGYERMEMVANLPNKKLEDLFKEVINSGLYEFTDLAAAAKSKNEVMIACDSYYLIPYKLYTPRFKSLLLK